MLTRTEYNGLLRDRHLAEQDYNDVTRAATLFQNASYFAQGEDRTAMRRQAREASARAEDARGRAEAAHAWIGRSINLALVRPQVSCGVHGDAPTSRAGFRCAFCRPDLA